MKLFYIIYDFLEGLFQGKSIPKAWNDSQFFNE